MKPRDSYPDSEPFTLLRRAIAFLMLGATAVSLGLAVTGIVPRAWILAAAIWTAYGIIAAVIGGLLEPAIDFFARVLGNAGFGGGTSGFSEIEALAARGEYQFAAERYRERADRDPRARATAMTRRAELLAGPLANPDAAVRELIELRASQSGRFGAADDILIGTTLAHFYEQRLNDPGKAMRELRRLLDTYPHSLHTQQIRRTLRALKRADAADDERAR